MSTKKIQSLNENFRIVEGITKKMNIRRVYNGLALLISWNYP